jgi:drug/metabolite transporter (DMT)-like permease
MANEYLDAATAAAARYAAPVVGVLIGTAARYGEALKQNKPLSWRGFLGDVLLLGIVVVLAILFSDLIRAQGNYKVVVGALTAFSAERLIRLVQAKFEARAASALDGLVGDK